MKRPLFNHTKSSCLICLQKNDAYEVEYSPDWFSYFCVECMEAYAKKWGIEFDK